MKAKIRKALKDDLDALEEVTSEEVENSSPEEVLEVVTEVLGEVAKELAVTADSLAKAKTIKAPTLKVGDADWKKAFRAKLMDTDSTEDVIELAKAELAVTDPASVVETVIEVLDDVIENLAEGE
jgi:chemotaxis protein CheY-P-specific phosphatase CheC